MQTLDAFFDQLAAHVARERGWSLADATRWIEMHAIDAREEYRRVGAPLGDTDEGFLAWLRPLVRPPAA